MQLNGIMPPVTTPFDSQGRICWDHFRQNLEMYNSFGLSGYVVAGSNGESPYLLKEEKLKLLEVARRVTPSTRTLIIGASIENTDACIDFMSEAAQQGADAALVGVPNYFKSQMTDAVITDHYRRIADRASLPILLYNVPQFTGVRIPPPVIASLASHPRVAGMKESSGDMVYLQEILNAVPAGFQLLAGSAAVLLPALLMGAVGAIVAIANAVPNLPVEIYREYGTDWKAILPLQKKLFGVSRAVTSQFGLPGLKYAMDLMGFKGGFPRSPLKPLSEERKESLRQIFQQAGLLAHAVERMADMKQGSG